MFHLPLPVKKSLQSAKKASVCPKEAIAWAAERMCLSYEQLKVSLTAEEMVGVKFAYESWKERTKDDRQTPRSVTAP